MRQINGNCLPVGGVFKIAGPITDFLPAAVIKGQRDPITHFHQLQIEYQLFPGSIHALRQLQLHRAAAASLTGCYGELPGLGTSFTKHLFACRIIAIAIQSRAARILMECAPFHHCIGKQVVLIFHRFCGFTGFCGLCRLYGFCGLSRFTGLSRFCGFTGLGRLRKRILQPYIIYIERLINILCSIVSGIQGDQIQVRKISTGHLRQVNRNRLPIGGVFQLAGPITDFLPAAVINRYTKARLHIF